MFEMCVLFNNVLLIALQTQVGFSVSVEEAASIFRELQFSQNLSLPNLIKKSKL